MISIGTIGTVTIFEQDDGSVTFTAGATIDGDGANGQYGGLPCYAPSTYSGRTLDILANAGHPGNWFGVVTNTGLNTGTPILQGAYVSSTSLNLFAADGSVLPDSSPFKYVDAATVPYISVPLLVINSVAGIVLGCRCVITNTTNGQGVVAVVADTGGGKSHR